MAKSGPETWSFDGASFQIASTYYLALPDGLQYTIDYQAPIDLDLGNMNDARAFDAVAPIMRHAATAKLYARHVVRDAGGNAVPVNGVHTHGFRVSRSLEQLQEPSTAKTEP
jgi:hypothetical protein